MFNTIFKDRSVIFGLLLL